MTNTTKKITSLKEADARIDQLMREVKSKINEMERLAVEFKTGFSSPMDVYGMGGSFSGDMDEFLQDLRDEYEDPEYELNDYDHELSNGGRWFSSSQSC